MIHSYGIHGRMLRCIEFSVGSLFLGLRGCNLVQVLCSKERRSAKSVMLFAVKDKLSGSGDTPADILFVVC